MKQQWSVVTGEQFSVYLADAKRLTELAEQHKIPTFAAALAGVALIRNAVERMGGEYAWWCDLITSGELKLFNPN